MSVGGTIRYHLGGGLWAAVSGGRGVLEGNRMAMGWMHRLRMWVKDAWRAWFSRPVVLMGESLMACKG